MRQLSPELATHLASGATTLAKCVVIERRDGQKLGFTSHDITLTFEGVIFEPDTGVETSETASHLGFAVGGLDIAGALQSDALNEDDLAAGLFDDAKVEVWIVNWTDISQRHLLHVGYIAKYAGRMKPLRRKCVGPCGRSMRSAGDVSAQHAMQNLAMHNAELILQALPEAAQ
jgi:uncharacterized phage protein (TIGR02218 family)